jgi:flagellar protein FliO/FliZ
LKNAEGAAVLADSASILNGLLGVRAAVFAEPEPPGKRRPRGVDGENRMSDILGFELGLPARFIVAFVLVLALIGLTAWLIRQFGSARASNPGGARNRQPRLAVLDSAIVDARRRLVLIRRDNVEHLILIGGPTDVVVEENIVRAQSAAAPAPMQRQAPMRAPIELEPEYDPTLVPYDEPIYEEPVRPAPAARSMPQRQAPRPPVEPARAPAPAPRPAPATRQDYDDVTKRLAAALRQPAADPALTKPKTEPRVPPAPATPAPAARPAAATPPTTPAAPAAAPAQKQGSDVFASLEEEMASLLRPSERKNPS